MHRMLVLLLAALAVPPAVSAQEDRKALRLSGPGYVGEWFSGDRPRRVTVTVRSQGTDKATVWIGASPTATHPELSAPLSPGEQRLKVAVRPGNFCVLVRGLRPGGDLVVTAIHVQGATRARVPASTGVVEHRVGRIVVHTRPGARVRVKQIRHAFWFGTAIAGSMFRQGKFAPKDAEQYLRILEDNFNAAVMENAMKWGRMQPSGLAEPRYADADRMLAWCEARGIPVRGHCVFWSQPSRVQSWLKVLGSSSLRRRMESRARGLLGRYKGRIPEYDVNNEMLTSRFYADRLGDDIRAKMFEWCRATDPDAALYTNEYDVINGGNLPRYEALLTQLIRDGVPVRGIGVQGHLGGPVSATKIRRVLDRLARFRLPIKITELDVNTHDEDAKALALETMYRTCFAHPQVTGIMLWGFWEGRHWRPAAALWKKNWTATPAARMHRRLLFSEWWTDWRGTADERGRCEVPAFLGTHLLLVDRRKRVVRIDPERPRVVVTATDTVPGRWRVAPETD